MIKRYEDAEIAEIWRNENKLALWQATELAVVEAMANLGQIQKESHIAIAEALSGHPIDLNWWLDREKIVGHDLNAFLEERMRFLPPELQIFWHKNITSYDTEEPAFARMLKVSVAMVEKHLAGAMKALVEMAKRYRYTIMNARTHGQEAELQSFGKRCLTWLRDLWVDFEHLQNVKQDLKYSKISGAIGNYGSIDPALEKEALRLLGFEPYYGATQIMPRELYAPLAQALCQIVLTIDKISLAIRLGARSGRPICQEPFGKRQKASSAMPHKKNTISTEQEEGMGRMAQGYLLMIIQNIRTWEERAIEQSCVERVAWPDLFHVTVHSLKTIDRVLEGLVVYPDNMLLEVVENRGCYASAEAKEVLKELGLPFGLTSEEAYRVVQLAAFNVFEPKGGVKKFRENLPTSLAEMDQMLGEFRRLPRPKPVSIQEVIAKARLRISPQLEISEEEVARWNGVLKQIFRDKRNLDRWNQIFLPSYLLRNEDKLYQEVPGLTALDD